MPMEEIFSIGSRGCGLDDGVEELDMEFKGSFVSSSMGA